MPSPDANAATPGGRCSAAILRAVQWVAAGFVAICLALSALLHLRGDRFDYSPLNWVLLLSIAAALCGGVWWLWFRFALIRLKEYSAGICIAWHLAAVLAGRWLITAIPLSPTWSWTDAIGLGFAALVISAWLATRPALSSKGEPSRWAWLWYSLPTALYWSYCLWVFWPAIISQDSIYQWREMTTAQYHDDHPAFHTMTNWLVTWVWHSPAAIAITQIVLLSLVVGWGLSWMRRNGMPRWLAIVTAALMAIAPANALLVITIWKDIYYCTALLALVLIMLACVQTGGEWLSRRLSWLWLALPAIAVYLYRHNGFPIVIAVFVVLPVVYRRQWRPVLLSGIICGACVAAVKGPLYRMLDVQPTAAWLQTLPYVHYIAAHVAAKTPLAPDERAVLDEIFPIERNESWCYDPTSVVPTIKAKEFDMGVASRRLPELKTIFRSLAFRAPRVTYQHVKNSSRIVWQIRWSPVLTAPMGFSEHRAVRFDPGLLERDCEEAAFNYVTVERPTPPGVEASLREKWHWLAWRPGLFLHLFLAACLAACIRSRSGKYLLVALPIVVQAGVMSLAGMSPDFRYHWAIYLTGLLMSGYLLLAIPRGEGERNDPTAAGVGPTANVGI